MTEPSGTAAKADEKLYLNLKEVHKMCYEKGIKNVIKKTKEKLLEELGIGPNKVSRPIREHIG